MNVALTSRLANAWGLEGMKSSGVLGRNNDLYVSIMFAIKNESNYNL